MATAQAASAAAGSRTRKTTGAKTPGTAASTDTARKPRRAPAAGRRTAAAAPQRAKSREGMTIPLVNLRVPALHMPIPGTEQAKQQTRWAAEAVRSHLPPTDRMLYYGGLGAAAALGALEWPVAVAAGAGVWVATHTRRAANRAQSE